MALRKISAAEISSHCHEDDAWIVINGVIWDVTGFAAKHPGGPKVIAEHVGRDGSSMYNDIHGPGLIASYLGPDKRIGVVDDLSKDSLLKQAKKEPIVPKPDLKSIVDLSQFETVAETALKPRAWSYISGATEDHVTHEANCEFYRRIFFRPQVLNGAGKIDTSTVFMGKKCSVPFFNAPTSSVKLSHPDGELALARASVAHGVPPILPTMSSYALSEIVDVMPPSYPFFFQLYMNLDRSEAAKTLRQARDLGAQAILVTVDLPVMSKRQNHDRGRPPVVQDTDTTAMEKKEEQTPAAGAWAHTPTNIAIDPDLQWKDIAWIRQITGLPVILKGIQSAADAKRAFEYGCSGIYISNHGGRALDTAPPAILVLLEIHATCPEILGKMDIMIDGGIRRGSDILKAICLGANVVCIGRPFLYALSYGEAGVNYAFDILKHELETAMALLGISSLDQAHPGLVNTSLLDFMVYRGDKHPWAAYPVPRVGGRPTKKSKTDLSEGESYLNLARENNFFFTADTSDSIANISPARIIAETHATDSYQNVLFSLLRFRLYTGRYPDRITIVSHAFKRKRFLDYHFPAIGWIPRLASGIADTTDPWEGEGRRIHFVGIDPPPEVTSPASLIEGEEKRGISLWKRDLYGTGPELAEKRKKRGWGESMEDGIFVNVGLEPVVERLVQWDGGSEKKNEWFNEMERLPWNLPDETGRK